MSRFRLFRHTLSSGTPSAPVKTGNPIIFGTPQVGQALTATHGTYSGTVTGYSGQWYSAASPIALATSLSYTIVSGDLGNNITYQESASNVAGSSATGTSNALGPVIAAGSITYDTSVGNGVDTNGFAALPLRAGAKYIYVKNGGSDAANGLTHATAVSTIAHGASLLSAGTGDQLLLAQGSTWAESLPSLYSLPGFSAVYPTVIQGYDPTDPTNTAKMGRAGTARPVVNTGGTANTVIANHTGSAGTSSPNYLAIRGLDISPPNQADTSLQFFGEALNAPCYVLIENNIFRYTAIGATLDQSPTRGTNWVFRNNSFSGTYSITDATGGQCIFIDYTDGVTYEDNVFYHAGWKIGANRSDDYTIGGLTAFRHPIYFQEDCLNGIARRNAFLDGYDGGSMRGTPTTYTQNLSVNNSVGFVLGRGDHYATYVPSGAVQDGSYNAVLGSAFTVSAASYDVGVWVFNGKAGQSSVHHNVFARSSAKHLFVYQPDALSGEEGPSHMTVTDFHDNVSWNWANSGSTIYNYTPDPYISASFENNVWDDPASGSNTNIATHTFSNTYDQNGLAVALGYADYSTMVTDMINNPEKHVQRQGVKLMLQGYSVDISAMPFLY